MFMRNSGYKKHFYGPDEFLILVTVVTVYLSQQVDSVHPCAGGPGRETGREGVKEGCQLVGQGSQYGHHEVLDASLTDVGHQAGQ